MFKKGEYVVCGNKGVCQIQDISPIDISGADKDRLYYIMRQLQDGNGIVYRPVDNTRAVIRRVISKEEAQKLIEEIPQIEQLKVPDEKNRELSYKEALKTCDVREWISIIKELYARREERLAAGKKITALDERYLKVTEHELYGELSIALGEPVEKMESCIQQSIQNQ